MLVLANNSTPFLSRKPALEIEVFLPVFKLATVINYDFSLAEFWQIGNNNLG